MPALCSSDRLKYEKRFKGVHHTATMTNTFIKERRKHARKSVWLVGTGLYVMSLSYKDEAMRPKASLWSSLPSSPRAMFTQQWLVRPGDLPELGCPISFLITVVTSVSPKASEGDQLNAFLSSYFLLAELQG